MRIGGENAHLSMLVEFLRFSNFKDKGNQIFFNMTCLQLLMGGL